MACTIRDNLIRPLVEWRVFAQRIRSVRVAFEEKKKKRIVKRLWGAFI